MLGSVLSVCSHVNNLFPDLIDALVGVANNSKAWLILATWGATVAI